eukprot:CAMPEP_0172190464 /NCGR_PEP_ID=MMETSP1050-20130122/23130_1 /TAXON_ID=233186 /ORGANISM="Cryptomonas curvata, Strain CCAP979/52" /LENGTH=260 /DNA_ID=CAMNT_0012865345 /DNA_START=66 /DNA_END=845 /DNA_ORIENTATION=+
MARNDFSPEMTEVTSDMVVIEPRIQHPNQAPWGSQLIEGVDDFRKHVSEFAGKTFSNFIPPPAQRTDQDDSSDDTMEASASREAEQKNLRLAQLYVKKSMAEGPTILLKCIDSIGGKKGIKDVKVEWSHSWEDVLRQLKRDFKRDVIFEYEVAGRVCRVHDDSTFDRAMALAEASGNKLFVVIQDAVWKTAPEEEVEPEEPEPEEQKIMITCANRMSYHPAKYKPLLFFATAGAAISLGVALAAISSLGDNWTYLFAHTI